MEIFRQSRPAAENAVRSFSPPKVFGREPPMVARCSRAVKSATGIDVPGLHRKGKDIDRVFLVLRRPAEDRVADGGSMKDEVGDVENGILMAV